MRTFPFKPCGRSFSSTGEKASIAPSYNGHSELHCHLIHWTRKQDPDTVSTTGDAYDTPQSPKMSCRAGVWTFRPRYLVGIVLILSTLVPTSIWLYGDSSYVEWIYPSPTDPASDFKDGITWKPSPPSSYSASSSPSHALSYPPDDELPQVHLFVPVNKEKVSEDARFCRVLQGAIVNGWKPIIFNWDVEVQQQKHKPYGESSRYVMVVFGVMG